MKRKNYVAKYQLLEHTTEKIREQFKEICNYLIAETNTIIPEDLSSTQSIKLSIELNPSEIIRIVRVYTNGVDFNKDK